MKLDYKIGEIPVEFVQSNLSNYQKDIIELKYHVYKRFTTLVAQGKSKMDAYQIIGEEVCLEYKTVQILYLNIDKKYRKQEV